MPAGDGPGCALLQARFHVTPGRASSGSTPIEAARADGAPGRWAAALACKYSAVDRLDRTVLREHSTTSARVQAYAALREAIVRAELEPGRQLSGTSSRRGWG